MGMPLNFVSTRLCTDFAILSSTEICYFLLIAVIPESRTLKFRSYTFQDVYWSSFSGDCYETVRSLHVISRINLAADNSIPCLASFISLEAATSRLEDLADDQSRRPRGSSTSEQSTPTSHAAAVPAAPAPPPPPPPPPPAPAPPPVLAEDPQSVTAYDEIVVNSKLKSFVELTKALGSEALVEQVS